MSDKNQRKMKATTNKATTNNLDTRTELAELVKRKAEISVSFSIQSIINGCTHFHDPSEVPSLIIITNMFTWTGFVYFCEILFWRFFPM